MKLSLTVGVVIFLFVAISENSYTQNIAKASLKWISAETENLKSSERFSYSCWFFSTPGEVQWVQKSGQRITRFKITGSDGIWEDIAQPGRVEFSVTRDDEPGKIWIEKNSEGTSITLDFTQAGVNAIRQRFYIIQVQVEN